MYSYIIYTPLYILYIYTIIYIIYTIIYYIFLPLYHYIYYIFIFYIYPIGSASLENTDSFRLSLSMNSKVIYIYLQSVFSL